MKCMHVCIAQTTYLFFTKLSIEPDFPCLADELAEPRPDMNIKVTHLYREQKVLLYQCEQNQHQARFFLLVDLRTLLLLFSGK